ncbi:Crp/Fnr family transcriptional regulator [Caproicibacterium sp. BJN0003]|uniref:Crp/Fnr family transcriptional regulator n=1 Tax=Caproicibacterium sp. BJN0003 TaxID=2994078 RepID=UPI00224D88CA|nr:Crp/Fnr family transcriptional regulator [Caproicibacterium sp. BJN0003]UZT81600.1 Crp/Fnr family transcriptional regulator [Caproicibacterium sp. BJN0003]
MMELADRVHCGEECIEKLCVHKVPIFSFLEQDDLIHIASLIHHREYRKGETLFSEGDSPDTLVIVNEGSVKAFKITPDGREQILYVFSEGDFFGERNLFDRQTAAYTTEALEPVKACLFIKGDFYKLLHAYPDIAIKIIEALEERMSHMESALQSMGVRNVDNRISTLLLGFADKYGTAVPEGILIRLPLSREGMANYLGITRETVSRKLGQLESEGVIRSVSNKSILVLDHGALELSAGVPS